MAVAKIGFSNALPISQNIHLEFLVHRSKVKFTTVEVTMKFCYSITNVFESVS